MANVSPIPYEQSSGRLRDIYDEILDSRDLKNLPNWAAYLGASPPALEGIWRMVQFSHQCNLHPLLVQLMMFAVSRANGSHYCAEYHGHLVLRLNNQLDYDDLLALCDQNSHGVIPESFQTAINVAIEQVHRRCNLPPEEGERLISAGFSEQECLEIFSIISCAQMLNSYTMAADVPIDEGYRVSGFRI